MSQLAHCPRDEQLNISHPHPPSPPLPPRKEYIVNYVTLLYASRLMSQLTHCPRDEQLNISPHPHPPSPPPPSPPLPPRVNQRQTQLNLNYLPKGERWKEVRSWLQRDSKDSTEL